ncbi:O-methyltransferase [Actinomadura sp. 3N508]|uniref:O-methyltransferase n=1 Tax=Actinomadura sp. 3N508 TaxID=3375153 RepID=UPI0037BC9336
MVMATDAGRVLARLEERSARERPELDTLNAQGARYTRAAAPRLMLDVGPDVGRLLNTLVRRGRARRVVEIGGSVGYSTIWLADAVADTGGSLVTIEADAGKVAELRRNVADAGFAGMVRIEHGDAAEIVPELPYPFDVVLIDHWKDLYIREFDLVWPRLAAGGVVVADNILEPEATAEQMRAYVEHVRKVPGACSHTLPLGAGVELTIRDHAPEESW